MTISRRALFGMIAAAPLAAKAAASPAPAAAIVTGSMGWDYAAADAGHTHALHLAEIPSHRHGITDPSMPGGIRWLWPQPGDPGYPERYA